MKDRKSCPVRQEAYNSLSGKALLLECAAVCQAALAWASSRVGITCQGRSVRECAAGPVLLESVVFMVTWKQGRISSPFCQALRIPVLSRPCMSPFCPGPVCPLSVQTLCVPKVSVQILDAVHPTRIDLFLL